MFPLKMLCSFIHTILFPESRSFSKTPNTLTLKGSYTNACWFWYKYDIDWQTIATYICMRNLKTIVILFQTHILFLNDDSSLCIKPLKSQLYLNI